MLIDSHAHLDYDYDVSTEELLAQAKAAGVERVITIAAEASSLERVREIAEKYPQVYFTTGMHPHDSKDLTPEIYEQIERLAGHPKCVAIGELGLDYHYDHSDREVQKRAFQKQLEFSAAVGKPVVIHTREADDDTSGFIREHSKAFRARNRHRDSPGVIHCFTSSAALAKEALDLGYYISFSGIITFKNAEDLRLICRDIVPIDRMLVETDSPFLAPIPHRGKKNQPAYTRFVAEKVAELKGLSFDEVARITTKNSEKLFAI